MNDERKQHEAWLEKKRQIEDRFIDHLKAQGLTLAANTAAEINKRGTRIGVELPANETPNFRRFEFGSDFEIQHDEDRGQGYSFSSSSGGFSSRSDYGHARFLNAGTVAAHWERVTEALTAARKAVFPS